MGGIGSGSKSLRGKSGKMSPEAIARREATREGTELLRKEMRWKMAQPYPGDKDGRTYVQVAAEKWAKNMIGVGNVHPNIRLLGMYMQFVEGMPTQKVEVTSHLLERTREELVFKLQNGYWPDEAKTGGETVQ